MMSRHRAALLALAVAAGALAFVSWFDHSIVGDAQRHSATAFDNGDVVGVWTVGTLLTAGTGLLLGSLVWRSRSAFASAIYFLVGGLFALLPWLLWNVADSWAVGSTLPNAVARKVIELWNSTSGPMMADQMVGAAMAVAAVATLVRLVRSHRTTAIVPAPAPVDAQASGT